MVTIGFPGSSYLMGVSFIDNKSDRVPTTWTLGLFSAFLLGFFTHNYLIVFTYIRSLEWLGGMEFLCTNFVILLDCQN